MNVSLSTLQSVNLGLVWWWPQDRLLCALECNSSSGMQVQQKLAYVLNQASLYQTTTCALLLASEARHVLRELAHAKQPYQSLLALAAANNALGSPSQSPANTSQHHASIADMHAGIAAVGDQQQPAVLARQAQHTKRQRHEQLDADSAGPSKRPKMQSGTLTLQQQQQHQQEQQQHQQQHQQQQQQHQQQQQQLQAQYEVILTSTMEGIKRLGLYCYSTSVLQDCITDHLKQVQTQPFLTQWCFVGRFAASWSTGCPVKEHFEAVKADMQQKVQHPLWLEHCSGSLCSHASQAFHIFHEEYFAWPGTVTLESIAEVLPPAFQCSYLLCLAGYAGSKSLAQFAAEVMQRILLDIRQASQTYPQAEQAQQVAKHSLECSMSRMQLQTTDTQNEGAAVVFQQVASACTEEFDITRFISKMEAGLVKLGLLPARLPQGSFEILKQEPLLVQLTILSDFCARVKSGTDQLLFLYNLSQSGGQSIKTDSSQPRKQGKKSKSMDAIYALARAKGVFEHYNVQRHAHFTVSQLPTPVQCGVACFAVGTLLGSVDVREALGRIRKAVTQMQRLCQ